MKIKLLDKELSNLIAAGEVVERPSSVIKELLENAIDAAATAITVEIKNGGISYIRVTDNGQGIEREDVPTAFMRHATSKLSDKSDLFSIGTLGFRGEALAAIAAVSRIELVTATENASNGTKITIEGGTVQKISDCGAAKGTSIIVRDLFFNTPARMKFLKKDAAESAAVALVVEKIAMSHPEIALKFIRDNKIDLSTPGDGKLESSIYVLWGNEVGRNILPVDYTDGKVYVHGYVSKPLYTKSNRTMQWFYINDRLVQSKLLSTALEESYKDIIAIGKFPLCVLFVDVDLSFVDINIHPAKTEVKFADDKPIYNAIYFAIKNTLSTLDKRPELKISPVIDDIRVYLNEQDRQDRIAEQKKFDEMYPPIIKDPEKTDIHVDYENPIIKNDVKYIPFTYDIPSESINSDKEDETFTLRQEENFIVVPCKSEENETEQVDESILNVLRDKSYKIVGELFNTFIIVEMKDEALLIDKHAAHERMIYEELKVRGASETGQILMMPLVVNVSRTEHNVVLDNMNFLNKLGFIIESGSNNSIEVYQTPEGFDLEQSQAILEDIIDGLAKNKQELSIDIIDKMLYSAACKAAVKGGAFTSELDNATLVARLMKLDDIKYCPHGRPVAITLTKYKLDREFKRIM